MIEPGTPPETPPAASRLTARRFVAASAGDVFAVLCDPEGHVEIDASGMLQAAAGSPVSAAGDRFVVHMDREALGDYPMGHYDVDVVIDTFEADREISWWIEGTIKPPIGHTYGYVLEPATVDDVVGTWVTSVYDWSGAREKWLPIFPVISEANLRATLGILDRVVAARSGVRRPGPRP